jgi:2-keto-4-pentenoate hydratase
LVSSIEWGSSSGEPLANTGILVCVPVSALPPVPASGPGCVGWGERSAKLTDVSSAVAARIFGARGRAELLDAADVSIGSMTDAYAVQHELTAARLSRGEWVVGWKLGYTSLAMRAQMGVDQPNFGPLTDVMVLGSGARVGSHLVQPKVEPEIAVRLGSSLRGRVSRAEVAAAVASSHAALEVVDSVWRAYRFTIEHNTADGSSAAEVVVGDELDCAPLDLDQVSVRLDHNGSEVASANGSAASGHPLDGVVWLVEQLAERGQELEAGSIVITGGLTAAVSLAPGDVVAGRFVVPSGSANLVSVTR